MIDTHFFERGGDDVWEFAYVGGSALACVALWRFHGEQLHRSVRFERGETGGEAWHVSEYVWRGDLLVRCETRGFDAGAGRALARAIQEGKVERSAMPRTVGWSGSLSTPGSRTPAQRPYGGSGADTRTRQTA